MSETIPYNTKLTDSMRAAPGGKVDAYWNGRILKNAFAGKRKAPAGFYFWDQYWLLEYFGLRGFEYGNWLNQEDRYVYLAGCAFAMRDFCVVIGLDPSYFGLKEKISIAFGARGGSFGLAHFEPGTWAINLTRFKDEYKYRRNKYGGSDGAGALGHEYGHALDFLAGKYIDVNGPHNFSTEILSSCIRKDGHDQFGAKYKRTDYKLSGEMQLVSYDLMYRLCFKKEDGIIRRRDWYDKLVRWVKQTSGKGDYWLQDIEVFARSFEIYLSIKCEKKRIQESFLKENKYLDLSYPPKDVIQEIEPLFDTWLETIYRRQFKVKIKPI